MDKVLGGSVLYVLTPEVVIDLDIEVSSLYAGDIDVAYLDLNKKEATVDKKKTEVKASKNIQVERVRVENKKQAERIAHAQKTQNEMKEFKGRVRCIGIPDIYASGKISLSGFGKFDREYYVSRVEHEITRNGYITQIEFYKSPQTGGKKKK
jgi:phage protein D